MEKHRAYHELLERLPQGGCAVCSLVRAGLDSYLSGYLEEGVTDEKAWGALKAAGGWCGRHARRLEARADGLAVALFYGHLLEQALAGLEGAAGPLQRLKLALQGGRTTPCPGCLRERESEGAWAHLLARAAAEPEAQAPMAAHLRLCVPHLGLCLRAAEGEGRDFLRRDQGAKLRALAEENAAFVRKSGDHGGGREALGPEADSWKRALRAWYGPRWDE